MPWTVKKGAGDCSDDEWAVIKDATGETEGCHATENEAKAHQRALYAREADEKHSGMTIVNPTPETVREYGVPDGWRGPIAELDVLTGDTRMLMTPGSGVRYRQFPMILTLQHVGEGQDNPVGTVDYAWVHEDGLLWGEGRFDIDGQEGWDVARRVGQGMVFTTSIHPDEVTFETRFIPDNWGATAEDFVEMDEATEIQQDGGMEFRVLKEGYRAVDVMTDWQLAGLAVVSIPAYDGARISPVWGYVPRRVEEEKSAAQLLDDLTREQGEDDAELARKVRKMRKRWNYEVAEEAADSGYDEDFSLPLVAAVSGSLGYPVWQERKRKWDGHTARQNVAKWASSDGSGDREKINWKKFGTAFLYRGAPASGNSDGNPALADDTGYKVEDFKLGYVDIIDGKPYIIPNGAIGIAGGHGVTATKGIPDTEKKAIKRKLCSLYSKIRNTHADFPECPFAGGDEKQALVAAARRWNDEQIFKAEFFDNPHLDGPTPITITEDGRVYGHLALWDSCYQYGEGGDGRTCRAVPRASEESYDLTFHIHGAKLEDGSVLPVGALTFGEGHQPHGGLRAAQRAYADVASVSAKIRVGNDKHGVWFSGQMLDSFDGDPSVVMYAPLSGHWEPNPQDRGRLALIAAHSVVTPGFRVPALVASVGEDGEFDALALAAPSHEVELDRDPRIAFAQLRARAAIRRLGVV